MLQIPNMLLENNDEANKIICKFINDRLISLMEEVITDELLFRKCEDGPIRATTLEELADAVPPMPKNLDELMLDLDFAQDVALDYLPFGYPLEKANQTFFGLYKLLKAEEPYVPEIDMEYVLYSIIQEAVDGIDFFSEAEEIDDPMFSVFKADDFSTIQRLPDEDRAIVKKALMEELDVETDEYDIEEEAERLMLYYEDLRQYDYTCFWDNDFLMLDEMTEDDISDSKLNDMLGIVPEKKPDNIIQFPVKGSDGKYVTVKAEIKINPWDTE